MLNLDQPRRGGLLLTIAAGIAIGVSVNFVSTALAGPAGSKTAIGACEAIDAQASEYGSGVALVRAELDKADKVADWQEHRYDELPDSGVARGLRSNLRDIAPDDTVAVCIYSGTFVTPVGPPALDGMTKPPHDMLRLLVLADGTVTVDAAGYSKSGMKPETPDDWRPAG